MTSRMDPVATIEKTIPIVEKMGVRVVTFKPNYAKLMLPMAPNINHIGCIYAGSLFTLGELAGGAIFHAAFDNTRFVPIVKEISIRFRRMALSDVTVEVMMTAGEAETIRKQAWDEGKADFDLNLEVKDRENEICSLLHGTWQIRRL